VCEQGRERMSEQREKKRAAGCCLSLSRRPPSSSSLSLACHTQTHTHVLDAERRRLVQGQATTTRGGGPGRGRPSIHHPHPPQGRCLHLAHAPPGARAGGERHHEIPRRQGRVVGVAVVRPGCPDRLHDAHALIPGRRGRAAGAWVRPLNHVHVAPVHRRQQPPYPGGAWWWGQGVRVLGHQVQGRLGRAVRCIDERGRAG